MRTLTACTLAALFGAGSTFAIAAGRYDDSDMSYTRVTRVEPIYASVVYRDFRRADNFPPTAYTDRQFCAASADGAYREEVVAYRVYYRYHGHDLVREMAYDPGPLLKLRTNVESED